STGDGQKKANCFARWSSIAQRIPERSVTSDLVTTMNWPVRYRSNSASCYQTGGSGPKSFGTEFRIFMIGVRMGSAPMAVFSTEGVTRLSCAKTVSESDLLEPGGWLLWRG